MLSENGLYYAKLNVNELGWLISGMKADLEFIVDYLGQEEIDTVGFYQMYYEDLSSVIARIMKVM